MILVAGLVHDVAHPGLNNAFLVLTRHKQAVRYNDKSPLENMHLAKAFKTLYKPECNFLEAVSKDIYSLMRVIVIEMVLATDNAMHAKQLNELNNKLESDSPDHFDFNTQSNLISFLQL